MAALLTLFQFVVCVVSFGTAGWIALDATRPENKRIRVDGYIYAALPLCAGLLNLAMLIARLSHV